MEEKKQSVQEEQTREIFDELRGWNDDDFNEAFQELEIENCNISTEKKKLLVMLNMLDGVKQKGWFFATNQLLCELSGMKDRTLTRTKKYFKDLKIINFRRGCKEHSTDYKFNRKNIINLPKIKCGVLPNKSGDSPIVKSGIRNSISDSYQVQHATFFNTIENGVPYTDTYTEKYSNSNSETYSKKESYTDSNTDNNINKKDNNIMDNLINILIENNKELIENINRNNKELTTSILSLKNGNETNSSIETYKKEIEEKDNLIKTLQDEINKIQDEVSTLVEKKDIEIENLKTRLNNSIEYFKKIRQYIPKELRTTNGKETNHSSSTSIESKIISHSLDVVTKYPTKDKAWKQEKALQEAKQEQSPKVDTKTTVQENNYKDGERNYVLQKLDNLKNGWIEKINTVTTEEQLYEYSNESLYQFSDFAKIHVEFQKESDETFKELQPLFEAKYNQFQSNKETTPKAENCEEKKETTAEPNTDNSKNVEVSKTDTPNDKEKTQEEIDKEFEKETSSMFLTDTKQAVSTKKSEEVKFPETKVIPLREGEEKRQFQELVDNQTLNRLLKDYSEKRNFDEILTEIRKAITKGNYPKKIVNAYIEYAWNTYTFDCEVQDAMKPLEDTKEGTETTAETTSTPKGDSLAEFLKDKVDNIKKNAEENGNELPFGKNPKSRYQDVDESNCYQSEEEKVAMAATCSYDETQDAVF